MPVRIKKSSVAGETSLTPMIDVVFLLLIFFLIESRFANEERTMPIELPNAVSAVPMTQRPRELVVEIDRDGAYLLDGKALALDQIEQLIAQAVSNNPTTQAVIVRADRRSQLQAAVSVIDLCGRLGAEHSLVISEQQP